MNTVRIGTVDLPQKDGWDGYWKRLSYLELTGLHAAPPRAVTLTKWAEACPAGTVGLLAPWVITHAESPLRSSTGWQQAKAGGEFRDSGATRSALKTLAEAADVARARAVIFQSPPALSASAHNRDVLRRFFTELAPASMFEGRQRVWVPSGLWDTLTAVTFAGELGVVCAIDPLIDDPDLPIERMADLPAESIYMRPVGMGRAGTFSADRLDQLSMLIDCFADVTVAFATSERFKDAQNLTRLRDSN
jgi:uncharacterized protein YecE (DUF72 family)